MKKLIKVGLTIFSLQIWALGLADFSLAQEALPPSQSEVDETPPDEGSAGPGFEVIPPTQGEAISILPLEEMPTAPQDDESPATPDADEMQSGGVSSGRDFDNTPQDSDAQQTPPESGIPGFAPLQDDTGALAPENMPPLIPTLRSDSSLEGSLEPLSYREVTVRALEKVTARTEDIVIPIGETVTFNAIDITLRTCNKRPPEEPPETTAFLEVSEEKPDGEIVKYFSGWMFASSPGLNGLEHPVYDVWVIDCKISEPIESDGNE